MIRRVLAAMAALVALTAAAPAPTPRDRIAAALSASGFRGAALVSFSGDAAPLEFPTRPGIAAGARWPWASVTKQVVATMVMQQVEAGTLALDAPASRWLPELRRGAPSPTIRQLLQHRAGLRNPDDTSADPAGIPAFWRDGRDRLAWCVGERGQPGGDWRYNNCDYLALGAILERVTHLELGSQFALRVARPAGMAARFVEPRVAVPTGGAPTPAEVELLARFGAAGGLYGTPRDLLAFDRALLDGRLLRPAARATLWNGDPKLGFQALGQWVFEAPLKGCPKPVRIVERRGGIGRFQVRNIILPDTGTVVILFTDDGDFEFGEIWQGKGASHDLLAAAVCGGAA